MAIDFVEKFKRYLKEDGKSPKTIESYVGDIAGFVSYIQNMGVRFQGELKRFYVTSFRNYLIESQYETATINKKINSIQSFNVFLMKNNYTSECVVDLRKDRMKVAFGSEKQVEVFSEKQVERMLFYMQNEDKVGVIVNKNSPLLGRIFPHLKVKKINTFSYALAMVSFWVFSSDIDLIIPSRCFIL